MKAKCRKCGDTVEVTHTREYKTCKCGAIGLDYGDPPYYYRVCGNPEDFDGEVEDAPETIGGRSELERATDIIGEENIGGYSGEDLATCFTSEQIEPTITDSFWVEMAEHFKAMAKLCEERGNK